MTHLVANLPWMTYVLNMVGGDAAESEIRRTSSTGCLPAIAFSSVTDSLPVPGSRPDPAFHRVQDLSKYWVGKIEDADKRRRLYKKPKPTGPATDSTDILDSICYQLSDFRIDQIRTFLLENEKNQENLIGILYMVVAAKTDILQIDSPFNIFPRPV